MSKVELMKIDLTKPKYDQSTYWGRARHFFQVTNPLNILASDAQLDEAKKIVDTFKTSKTLPPGYDIEKLWQAKYLYDSAFHPDTGEKMHVIGRMSAQAPMNTLITGGMIIFYKTSAGTIFFQWLNQTFNALVNYTNRSGDAPLSATHLMSAYCAACGGALTTALYLNAKARAMSNPLFGRLVPFAAVCAANFINIPMMRSHELMNGTPVFTVPGGVRVGESRTAATTGILYVCLSRIFMAIPGMTITPALTNFGVQRGWFCHSPKMVIPFQLVLVGISVTLSTPLGCALFNQRATLPVDSLEPELKSAIKKKYPLVQEVFYNKGL